MSYGFVSRVSLTTTRNIVYTGSGGVPLPYYVLLSNPNFIYIQPYHNTLLLQEDLLFLELFALAEKTKSVLIQIPL